MEALAILSALGIPTDAMTERRKERMAKAFLAVAGMTADSTWEMARADNRLRSRDVISWMNKHLGERISSGSYDDIRRKDLILPVAAGLVLKSAGKDGAATNDGTRAFALTSEAAELLKFFGSPRWAARLDDFTRARVGLAEQLHKARLQQRIPITIGATELLFGPGEHNQLQKAIVEDFLPNFGSGARILYVGDTEDKFRFIEREALRDLGFFDLAHEELPDVVAYSESKNWLFVIEAVHSANPITELRKRSIEQLTRPCNIGIVYVTAFMTRDTFRRFSSQIAWETEVWIAEAPQHLIHFNGDKFLGPHRRV
jgi:hypothetical protein